MSDEKIEEPTVEEVKPPTEEIPAKPKANWEYKKEFKIVGVMREVILKTIEATQGEVTELRKKLEKLQYGG